MSAQNGTIQNAVQNPVATGDPISNALATLIQQAGETNDHLRNLTTEISTMNRQLFGGGTQQPPAAQQQQQPAAAGPVPTIVEEPIRRERYFRGECALIGITKTKMTGRWKVNFYPRGSAGRPASAYGPRTGDYVTLIALLGEVWPEISDDHFSNEEFYTKDAEIKKQTDGKGFYEARYTAPPFMVEWHESSPDVQGRTWAYVDRVYPLAVPPAPAPVTT